MSEAVQGLTIENLGVLDLTGKTAEGLAGISLIHNVGLIIVPSSLADAVMRIPQKNVGSTLQLPDETGSGKLKVFTGQISLSGESLANAGGSPDDILVVAGQALITSHVDAVGYRELIVMGQLMAPKSSESALSGALTRMMGQVFYYKGDVPRVILGSESYSRAFLELLDKPISLVVLGDCEFEADVDVALMKAKVGELVVLGTIRAPKRLIPLVQLLAETKLGDIVATDDHAGAQGA
ncbi:hypothetical protein I8J29_18665 [Paenibacillus sp. MWE-103]|uniref:Uncharacterized protein n=1 Tax=Paenibacillus artemisiicola TaxID=1172618 RepID=A0ABS3WD38_9BACL|nr:MULTISPECIES: hypothetical protein [Paenibacillus]MBO7746235.1 hypothetical protein [Paenibacillus artemisiicola]SFJ74084.1 hypothetical protein SAMN02799624_05769 [Paenibacillus sp. UNC496MF]